MARRPRARVFGPQILYHVIARSHLMSVPEAWLTQEVRTSLSS
jgi:hypothetical protein